MKILGKTKLTTRALQATLMPYLTALFFGGIPGLWNIMSGFNDLLHTQVFPTQPVFSWTWGFWWEHPEPSYLTMLMMVLALVTVLGGFLKLFLSDQLVEHFGFTSGIRKILSLSTVGVVVWVFFIGIIMVIVGYPLRPIPIGLGVLMIVLHFFAFTSIPAMLTSVLELPSSTTQLTTVLWVVGVAHVLAFVITHVFVVGMQSILYWSLVSGL